MNVTVIKNSKFDLFNNHPPINPLYLYILVLSAYLTAINIYEFPYLETIYNNTLFTHKVIGLTHFQKSLVELKALSGLIYSLIFFKLFAVIGLLFDKTRSLSAFVYLLISANLMLLSSTDSPEKEYIHFSMLLILLFPSYFSTKSVRYSLPRSTNHLIWISFGLSYSVSGFAKLLTAGWAEGGFLKHLVETTHAFNESFVFVKNYPLLLSALNYFALLTEILALPLCLHPRSRLYMLSLLSLFQFGLLVLFEFRQISIGMLIIHFFMWIIHKYEAKP